MTDLDSPTIDETDAEDTITLTLEIDPTEFDEPRQLVYEHLVGECRQVRPRVQIRKESNHHTGMAKTEDTADEPGEDEMLPDEAEAIAERLDSLDDEHRRSLSDVADALDDDE